MAWHEALSGLPWQLLLSLPGAAVVVLPVCLARHPTVASHVHVSMVHAPAAVKLVHSWHPAPSQPHPEMEWHVPLSGMPWQLLLSLPGAAVVVPAASQATAPALDVLPAGQVMHEDDADGLYVPAGQFSQPLQPRCVPGGQALPGAADDRTPNCEGVRQWNHDQPAGTTYVRNTAMVRSYKRWLPRLGAETALWAAWSVGR